MLSDFGRSKLIDHRGFTTSTVAGSARYLAPELLEHSETSDMQAQPSSEADVYAFSMVALEVSDPPHCFRILYLILL